MRKSYEEPFSSNYFFPDKSVGVLHALLVWSLPGRAVRGVDIFSLLWCRFESGQRHRCFFIHFPFIFYFANVAKTPLRVNSSTNKNQNLVEVKKNILLLPGLEPAPYKSEKNRRPWPLGQADFTLLMHVKLIVICLEKNSNSKTAHHWNSELTFLRSCESID